MPRPKRVKRESPVSAAFSSSSAAAAEDNPKTITKAPRDTPPLSSDDGVSDSIDPALLDEEEAPGLDVDELEPEEAESNEEAGRKSTTSTQQRKQQRSYAGGAGGFNALKSFNGQIYSGMAVGGSHTWNYDQGVWKETKEEPDLWKIEYQTTKRRARNAPKGSGAPVGTEYHWFIVAHQHVKKLDANTYETRLEGSKYKLAHKTATSKGWSVPTVKGQREREVELLEDAKRRVLGMAPVHAGEKVKVEQREKGQQKLDMLFGKAPKVAEDKKRKRAEEGDGVA